MGDDPSSYQPLPDDDQSNITIEQIREKLIKELSSEQIAHSIDLEGTVNALAASKNYVACFILTQIYLFTADKLQLIRGPIDAQGRADNALLAELEEKTLLIYNNGTNIMIYDIETEEIQSLTQCKAIVTAIAVNGSSLLIGDATGQLQRWNILSQELKNKRKLGKAMVKSICYPKQSNYIFVGLANGKIVMVYKKGLQKSMVLEGHSKAIKNLDITTDGEILVSTSSDFSVKLWMIKERRVVYSQENMSETIASMYIEANDNFLLLLGSGTLFSMIDIKKRQPIIQTSLPKDQKIKNLVYESNTSRAYFTRGVIGKTSLTLIDNGRPLEEVVHSSGDIDKFSKILGIADIDGQQVLFVLTKDNKIENFSCEDWQPFVDLNIEDQILTGAVANTTQGPYLVLTSERGKLLQVNLRTSQVEKEQFFTDFQIIDICFATEHFLVLNQNNELALYQAATFEQILIHKIHEPIFEVTDPFTRNIVKHPEYKTAISENYLIAGIGLGNIYLFNYADQVTQTKLQHKSRKRITALKITRNSEDVEILIAGQEDGQIILWDVTNLTIYSVLQEHLGAIQQLVALPDQNMFFSLSQDVRDEVLDSTPHWNVKMWSIEENTRIAHGSTKINFNDMSVLNSQLVFLGSNTIALSDNPLYCNTATVYPYRFQGLFRQLAIMVLMEEQCNFSDFFADHVIFPYRFNLLHLFVWKGDSVNFKKAALAGCKYIEDEQGLTPLDVAMELNDRQSAEWIIKYLPKYILPQQPYVLSTVEDDFANLNEREFSQWSALLEASYGPPVFSQVPEYGLLISGDKVVKPSIGLKINRDDFLQPEDKVNSLDEVIVRFWMSKFRFNLTLGNQENIDMLWSIVQCEDSDALQTPLINDIVNYLWEIVQFTFFIQCSFYIALLVLLQIYCLQDSPDIGISIAIFVINGLFLAYETFQFIGAGYYEYLTDIWNVLDMVRIIFVSIYIIMNWAGANEGMFFVMCVACTVTWLRAVAYFRIFGPTRYFIRMLLEVMQDMLAFLIILIFSILGFALLFMVYTEGNINADFISALKLSYRVVHGDWDLDGFQVAEWIWFIMATLVNPLILLNLLIAIMGDTYSRVQGNQQVAEIKELAEMIIEFESCLFWRRNQGHRQYIVRCTWDEDDTMGNTVVDATNYMKNQIKVMNKSLLASQEVVTEANERIARLPDIISSELMNMHRESMDKLSEIRVKLIGEMNEDEEEDQLGGQFN